MIEVTDSHGHMTRRQSAKAAKGPPTISENSHLTLILEKRSERLQFLDIDILYRQNDEAH